MAHFIKTGYWESSALGYKGWLNIEDLISASSSSIYTNNGSLTSNRTITMGVFTLSFEKDIIVNGINVGKGKQSLLSNTAIGRDTLISITGSSSINNSAFGNSALKLLTTGTGNTAVGGNALLNTTTGVSNNAFGNQALQLNTIGSLNIGIGNRAAYSVTGNYNIAIGSDSLYLNSSGANNTAIGGLSIREIATGSYNVAIGYAAGRFITTGSYNTIIGSQITSLGSSLSNNIVIADGQSNMRLVFNSTGQGVAGGSAYPTFVTGIQFDIIGKARATSLNLSALHTSSAGLSSGDLWNNAGVVNIVP